MTDEGINAVPEQPTEAPPAPAAPPAPPAPGYIPPAPPAPAAPAASGEKQKMVAGVLAILLGALGIHKFYLGYQKEGIIMLAISVVGSLLVGLGPGLMGLLGVVEGIMYLTKTDEEFYQTYVVGQKPWL